MSDHELIETPFIVPGADAEQLVVIGTDLEYLARLPMDRLPTHAEVRFAASILRRLFIDDGGLLLSAWSKWRAPSRNPLTVLAIDLDWALEEWPEGCVKTAWAGGAELSIPHVSSHIYGRMAMSDIPQGTTVEEHLAELSFSRILDAEKPMRISTWLKSTSLAVQMDSTLTKVDRATVIKYIANRKGGVHFDPHRRLQGGDDKERAYALLDHGLLRVGHLRGPEFEILSMVHSVVKSPFAPTLIDLAKSAEESAMGGDVNQVAFWDGQEWATFTSA